MVKPTRGAIPCFNPRTYIRYDLARHVSYVLLIRFQSTYLYKVRLFLVLRLVVLFGFQSTYLYKVRLSVKHSRRNIFTFQSTYLYKVRPTLGLSQNKISISFNPRTYIRYDLISEISLLFCSVSIHVPI